METRANYLMVGGFVLLLAAGLVIFVLWLAKFQFDVRFDRYDIRYEGSVTGLKVGSPVRYRGVRVGEVTDVTLDPKRPNQVLVTVEVEARTPVRSDTYATLELEGLTGGLYVLLSGTTLDAAPLEKKQGERRAVIASRRSTLQQVLEGAPELVQKVDLLLARASDILNEENQANFSAILKNAREFSEELAQNRAEIGGLIRDAGVTMEHLRGAAGAIEDTAVVFKDESGKLVDRVDGTLTSIDLMATGINASVTDTAEDARALIGDLRSTAKNFSTLSQELTKMVAENREGVRDFTSTGLSELTVLLVKMQDLVGALNRVTTEIERDPARFFFGDTQKGFEAQ